ncbi:hypothetical protein CI109_100454 [Kwoniella shandongensis]|uniref:RRN7-type domain-containing protein n=1 Tax=Kwoniella shandongensis TaxID=1734106 RepID=A0AAJ8LFQ2_9TREE
MARKCQVCGSRKWRKDKVTGNAVCEEGHVLQDFRSENHVVDGMPTHALTKRRLVRGPRHNKRKEEGRANPEFYHHEEAEYLRLQGLQILLRLQVQALSKLWSLPEAFEMIVRDLWAYQLAISSLPLLPDSSEPPETPSPRLPSSTKLKGNQSDVEMDHKSDERESDSNDSLNNDEKDSEDDDGGTDSELDAEVLERLTDSEKEEQELKEMSPNGQRRHAKWKRRRRLRVSDTIVTLVVGLWILRIPAMYVDLETVINEVKIPYIDFGHTTFLSDEMKRHMNRDVLIGISPLRSPTPSALHRSCKVFARVLYRRYGIHVPEVNVHPIAWRVVSSLATTYAQTLRLLALLDINISLLERDIASFTRRIRSKTRLPGQDSDTDTDQASEEKRETYERTKYYLDIPAPEVSVAAAWMIIMKMAYGLDGMTRSALLTMDPLINMPDGVTWIDELRKRTDRGTLKGSRRGLDKQDFISMDEQDIDAYLFKCESVLLNHRQDIPDANPFTLSTAGSPPVSLIPPNSWHSHHINTQTVTHAPLRQDETNRTLPLMPGEKILSYDSTDITGELEDTFEVVLRAASEVVGWETTDLMGLLEVLERRLERIRMTKGDEEEGWKDARGRSSRLGLNRQGSGSGTRSVVVSREASRSRSGSMARRGRLRASRSFG